jgi:hypothetical protein
VFLSQSCRSSGGIWLSSEFNVQMLYLPGLKNAVADFFFMPTHTGAIWNCCRGGRSSRLHGYGLKSSEKMFFKLAQYFTPWEARLPVHDFF